MSFEEAVDQAEITNLGWDDEAQFCPVLQTNGYLCKLLDFIFCGFYLTIYKLFSASLPR